MMKKIMLLILYFIMTIIPINDTRSYETVQSTFSDSYEIVLIENNQYYNYDAQDPMYQMILTKFEDLLKNAHQVPALGVSIDELTREKMKVGIWLEFKFKGILYNSDMPFESLLVEVSKDYYGFNVIRKYQGKYEGRCFYVNLDNRNMNEMYAFLANIN